MTSDDPALARGAINAAAGSSVDVRDYGAACDGTTDDAAAFASALSAIGTAGGGTLLLPPASIAMTVDAYATDANSTPIPMFDIPANTTIQGVAGVTTILISTDTPAEWATFLGGGGDNVTIDSVILRRVTNSVMFFVQPGAHDGFHLRDCVIDGQRDTLSSTTHAIGLNRVGTKSNFTMKGCTVHEVATGLLQSNAITDTFSTAVIDDCTFFDNYGDDLQFNAPNSTMTDVTVVNSRFLDNQATVTSGGYGVGLAHVENSVISNNYFSNYFNEGIHIEDYCANVSITGNRLVHCGQATGTDSTSLDRGSIVATTGCSDFTITGNTIDNTANVNTNGLHSIVAKPLTGSNTPGGHSDAGCSRFTVSGNTIQCGDEFNGMWLARAEDVTVTGNTIVGGGDVASGAYDDANDGWGIKLDGLRTSVTGNNVTGFRYGIGGPLENDSAGSWGNRRALGDPGTVSGNTTSDCYVGILAVRQGRVNISGNTQNNCVRPLVAGKDENGGDPAVVTGNLSTSCTHLQEVGSLVVQRTSGGSTVAIGSSKTVEVENVLGLLAGQTGAVGKTIRFSGGGTLTLTTAVTAIDADGPANLVGTVSDASIAAGEYGVAYGLEKAISTAGNLQGEHFTGSGESTFNPLHAGGTLTVSNSFVRLAFFTATTTESINNIRTFSGATAGVGSSSQKVGVYDVDSVGSIRLLASSANDTGLWTTAHTAYTTPLTSTFDKVAGARYAVAVLAVGSTTAPTIYGCPITSVVLGGANELYVSAGFAASDFTAGVATSSFSGNGTAPYAMLLP